MFALYHIHYATWLTIHVIGLLHLPAQCPEVYDAFLREDFFTQKTTRKFSCLAHEQQYAIVKKGAGCIGISENESALKRWIVVGPEIGRILNEYDLK